MEVKSIARKISAGLTWLAAVIFLATAQAQAQSVITAWNFDPGGTVAAPDNSPAPTTGSGKATVLGMNNSYNSTTSTASADVTAQAGASTGAGSYSWRIRGAPGNGWSSQAAIGTQGAEFDASTVGYTNIQISFDAYFTTYAPAKMQLQYTTNGSTWINASQLTYTANPAYILNNTSSQNTVNGLYFYNANAAWAGGWINGLSANLSAISTVANNPNFGLRFVNAATGTDDVDATGAAYNNSSGNVRFDNVVIKGVVATGCSLKLANGPSNQTTCPGGSATFAVAATGNNITYQWQVSADGVNYNNISGATLSSFTTNHPVAGANGDLFRCVLTNACDVITSSVASLTVTAGTTPSVSVSVSPGTNLCAGVPVVFTALATDGGASPAYDWYLNGALAGASASFTNNSPASGDRVYVVLTSSDPCATSPTATSPTNTMVVNAIPVATIAAAGSVPANSVGNQASVPNAGAGASYGWTISNGTISAGGGTSGITYTAGPTGSVALGCTVTNSSGCSSSTGNALVTINQVFNPILQRIKTVFVIACENHNFTQPTPTSSPEQILGNPAAPYINSLITPGNPNAAQVSYPFNYYNAGIGVHGSEPNYVWSEAGTDFGVHSSADPSSANGNVFTCTHLTSLLNAAGIPWKNYQEDLEYSTSPLISTAFGVSTIINPYHGTGDYIYAVKHNPMAFFSDTQLENVYPLTNFLRDLSNNAVGRYNWITPDEYNEAHTPLPEGFTYRGTNYTGDQAAVAAADNFMSIMIPKIMASSEYTNNGLIVIWWDETEGGDTTNWTLPTILISPLAKGNAYASTLPYSHSSDLKTMEEIFGLPFVNNAIPSAETDAEGTGYNTVATVNDFGDMLLSVPAIINSGLTATPTNGFTFSFTAGLGQTYRILASTNLNQPATNWTVLTNGTCTNLPMTFTDPGTMTNGLRFYQIASP